MTRIALLICAAALLPVGVHAAPTVYTANRSVLIATSSAGNSYATGATVALSSPVGGDFSAAAGSITVAAPVAGDAFLAGGSVSVRAPVGGDLRFFGGSFTSTKPVGGDFVALGGSVREEGGGAESVFVGAADAELLAGARGPVTIYANTATLAGTFAGDVRVVATGRLTLAASTTIRGHLSYDAPEKAAIPSSASVLGGITYTNTSYVPGTGASRMLALASLGIFLLARILGALILAGLFAGLFPRLAESMASRAASSSATTFFLSVLLGFAAFVATPVLLILLALTFVGIGLAILLFIGYCLLLLLSLIYAGILLGALFSRRFLHRDTVLWRDGVLGMLALSIIALVPFIGTLLAAILTAYAAGALLLLFFHTAFPRG